ncbi:MAG: elongation factor G [Bacteroidales bacterium]|jgi:elongation factor G|nr:elongation factor G [Bacteroidales bacterium]
MKVYSTTDIRNIALAGGAKAGKTLLGEAMAFEGKVISRMGAIEDKNTLSDYREIEIERQNSVVATLLYSEINNRKINIVDCPGIPDYIGEPLGILPVVEAVAVVVNATNGIEVGTEIIWRKIQKQQTPAIIVVNQLDHEKANFDDTLRDLKENFGAKVTVVQYPVYNGTEFEGVIDLILQKYLKFPKGGGAAEVLDIPASEKDKAAELYTALVEASASGADDLMEKYFETSDLTIEEMRRGVKLGLRSQNIYPVMCVSAKQNKGVARLLEFIGNNVTPPNEGAGLLNVKGESVSADPSKPFSALVFKTTKEQHLGDVAFLKIMSGTLSEGQDIVNNKTDNKERISQLMVVAGKNRIKVEKAEAGDIVITMKLKDVKVGSTLAVAGNDVQYAATVYPEPIFSTAIKADNSADDEKLGTVLNEIHAADPTFIVEYSRELKQIIIKGQGEFHINTVKWMLDKIYKIPTQFITPKIPYRETITKSAEATYRHKKQSGGAGQFGEVWMLIEPYYEGMANQTKYPVRGTETHDLSWGGKLVFNNCIVGGAIDARFMPAILKGIMEKMEEGPLTGSYARDIVVNIFDGKMHPVDSNEMAFKLAGRNAFREAFKNAGPKILEPIYLVDVTVPADRMGDVMTDLQGRRAVVMGMNSEGNYQIISAKVPLAEMNRYATTLSSLTSGRATYGMKFSEYQQVPTDVQNVLLKAYEEAHKEENE